MKIKITVGDLTVEGELDNTTTGQEVAKALPIKTSFSTWGDEIYFTIPVDTDLDETAREEVDLGDRRHVEQHRQHLVPAVQHVPLQARLQIRAAHP